MRLSRMLTFLSWFHFVGEIWSYYLEIRAGKQLDRDNDARDGQAYIPELEAGLYSCKNKELDYGWRAIWCLSVGITQQSNVYEKATFFTAYRPEFGLGQTLFLDEKDKIEPPTVMTFGFDPRNPDSPGIDAWTPVNDEVNDLVQEFRWSGCLPDDQAFIEDLLDYVMCNDVMRCILNNPDLAMSVMLPAVRTALARIKTIHEKHLKIQARMKKGMQAFFRSPTSSSDSDRGPIPSIPQLKTFIKLMVNKLLDPCILLKYAKTWEDKTRIKNNCKTYCQFFSTVTDVFGPTIAYKCTFLVNGSCSGDVCICDQRLGLPVFPIKNKVKMLYCDNQYRRSLNKIDLPGEGRSRKKKKKKKQPSPTHSESESSYASDPPPPPPTNLRPTPYNRHPTSTLPPPAKRRPDPVLTPANRHPMATPYTAANRQPRSTLPTSVKKTPAHRSPKHPPPPPPPAPASEKSSNSGSSYLRRLYTFFPDGMINV